MIAGLARGVPRLQIERQHASDIDDIHVMLNSGGFDVIHFSGHGSSKGIYLDKRCLAAGHEEVSAEQLRNLIALANKPPTLVVLMACYSNKHLPILRSVAPFVITAVGRVSDDACLAFAHGFYERLLAGYGYTRAFDHAKTFLQSRAIPSDAFQIHRATLMDTNRGRIIQSIPGPTEDAILINVDRVIGSLDAVGLSEEEFCHLLARRLRVHAWVFRVPRERCIIPIGQLLFGEFSWRDSHKVVACTKLIRLKADGPSEYWCVWERLLVSYNDLASSPYRALPKPADPENKAILARAVEEFNRHVQKCIIPAMELTERLGYRPAIPHLGFVIAYSENAVEKLAQEELASVVHLLEAALTNYHLAVDALLPPVQGSTE